MKKREPDVARLQVRFHKDPVRLRSAMVKLYRKHSIRPLRDSGMRGGLLQLPFLIALYSVIREGAGLAGRFLWIRNLGRVESRRQAQVLKGLAELFAPYRGCKRLMLRLAVSPPATERVGEPGRLGEPVAASRAASLQGIARQGYVSRPLCRVPVASGLRSATLAPIARRSRIDAYHRLEPLHAYRDP
jgi:hypothetical protein